MRVKSKTDRPTLSKWGDYSKIRTSMALINWKKGHMWWHFLPLYSFSTFSIWALKHHLYLLNCLPTHVVFHLNGQHYPPGKVNFLGSSSLSSSTLTFDFISGICLTFLLNNSGVLPSASHPPFIQLLSWLRELAIVYFHSFVFCLCVFYFSILLQSYANQLQENTRNIYTVKENYKGYPSTFHILIEKELEMRLYKENKIA